MIKTNILFISKETFLEAGVGIAINLTSGWFAVMLISPGILGVSSIEDYIGLLTTNLPFGIVSLVLSLLLIERRRSL